MRTTLLLAAVLLVSCKTKSADPPASAPAAPMVAEAPKPEAAKPEPAPMPKMELAETPADKLGTAPAGLGLKVGDKAPDATLTDVTGQPRTLSAMYAEGPTFVVFYRGGWCPFCNLQLHELEAAKPEFDKRGVHLVAISVDQPSEEAKTQAKHGVAFPMLSDSKLVAHKAFNVIHVPPEAEVAAMEKYGIHLAAYSGEDHHSFAVPSIFLIDRAGVIKFVHVDNDYKTRPSTKQMLAIADTAKAK